MKKILFFLLICVIKLSAYDYMFAYHPDAVGGSSKELHFINENNNYWFKLTGDNGEQYGTIYTIEWFNYIQKNLTSIYISNNNFEDIYKNDVIFLNDLYTSNDFNRQCFLNYLYNENTFSSSNFIHYDNYELLYNSDGLAVESIVDGVWSGLYSDSQKSKSGALYDKNGSLVYYNGKEVTPETSFLIWLERLTNKVVIDAFEEIRKSLVTVIIVSVVLVLGLFRLVLELLPSSISPRRRRYYGGGRGSLPDYGDGSQVAASVRARLAAKNRALKSSSENKSALSQSLVNGIIFDLENDR